MAEVVVLRVLEVLKGPMLREVKFLSGVSHQVQAAENELLFMKAFLKDADARQEEHESVRIWVAKVRDAAYDLEDVIVSFAMKVAAKRGKGMQHSVKRYLGILREGIDAHKVGSEIEKITEDLSAMRLHLQNYGIKEVNGTEYGGATSFMRLQEMRQTYPHVIEHGFVGLGKDEETLVECLVKEEKLSRVVSIWGMGGSGKTTLAKRVYHHAKVRGYFDRFAWVCVTQHCQSRKVWEEILIGLTSGTNELTQDISKMTNAEIVGKLCNIQLQRKCLVVLDDVWSCDAWKSLKSGFPVSAELKNQILLTTRCSEVAPYADINGLNYKSRLLSEDESWELFERIVTQCTKSNLNSTKQKLGKQMLAHCGGLPLAVTVLAGLLSKKISVDEWTIVNKHVDVFVGRGMYEERAYKGEQHYAGVSWVLGLSYDSLPHHLKPCFLYLASFPEDWEILVEPLTQLWIAEGFIEASAGKTVEDVTHECLIELEQLCLVQVGHMDSFGRKVKTCRMHDLMRDMCILKATEVNFMHTSNFSRDKDTKPATVGKVRRLAIYWDEANHTYAPTKSEKHVRSLLYFHDRDRVRECKRYCDVNRTLFPSLAKKLKMLRVLKLEYMCQKLKVTSNVGELVHLRFFSLKGTHFSKLPSSFADLVCLETLNLCGETSMRIWNIFSKMKRLRHLYLPFSLETAPFKFSFPIGGNLQTVVNLIIKDTRELVGLNNVKKLHVRGGSCLNVDEEQSVGFDNLESLHVRMHISGDIPWSMVVNCPNLYSLFVVGKLEFLPAQLVLLQNLTTLVLRGQDIIMDKIIETLDKLPCLKVLYIFNRVMSQTHGAQPLVSSAGSFPHLESFFLYAVESEWRVEEEAMPRLRQLCFIACPNLIIPDRLKQVRGRTSPQICLSRPLY